ncbi:MAG: hypothetical protein ACOZNI_01415 [Myxococcota bacterium]
MFLLLGLARASDPPIPEGCAAEALPGGLQTVVCAGVAVTWARGSEHGVQGATVLADPGLAYPAGLTGREPVAIPGATGAATAVLTLPGVDVRRIVDGHGADWMVTCSTQERTGALARCLEVIARSATR